MNIGNITFCLFLLICCLTKGASSKEVYSPNKNTQLKFWLDKSGTPYYQVTSNKKPLISSSLLGLIAKNGVNLN
ncbi:glycoside hydrolase family 97 N-terminal domain-containing protein [Arcticibacter eurypsychrophilus]|uniref:glycoside hydrolase family 97 N-terminal domain-containing protein n=1 Tax=Arcticibacter eurypsychrophilus TaxID=1434752 RepID=UPI00084D8FD9|nr:glycoside hydrolase family 97 N-terminal domain-containing protein [Arcticibacter eurypsychrophilus]